MNDQRSKAIDASEEEDELAFLERVAFPPVGNGSNKVSMIRNYAQQRRVANPKVVFDEEVRYSHANIRLPRDNGRQKVFDEGVSDISYKDTLKMYGPGLLEGRERFVLTMPKWIVEMLPLKCRSRILAAAGILGSGLDGHEVKLGQIEIDRNNEGRKLVTASMRFTIAEQERLVEFGRECALVKTSSIIRTAIFIGLSIPDVKEGVINPPWQHINGWEQGWREDKTFDLEFLERILILSGCMDRELFERRGCAILDALEYYRRKGGIEELTKRIKLAMSWAYPRVIDTIVALLDNNKKNIMYAQKLRGNNIKRRVKVVKAQRQTAKAKAEENV